MKKISLITTIICFLMVGCKKSISPLPIYFKFPGTQYFPLVIGNTWIYNVDDSSYSVFNKPISNYDVKVTVTSVEKMLDQKDAFVLKYEFPDMVAWQFVRISNDTIKYFPIGNSVNDYALPQSVFAIPFSNNQKYHSIIYPGTSEDFEVSNQSKYKSQFLNIDNPFFIARSGTTPPNIIPEYYIFKPFVGFLEYTVHSFGVDNSTSQKWRLKSYLLK